MDAADLLAARLNRPPFMRDAGCKEHPELDWFPAPGESTTAIRAVCTRCLVLDECRSYALDTGERFGVWGGLTTRERRRIRVASSRENAA